jgi:hypothetical protein
MPPCLWKITKVGSREVTFNGFRPISSRPRGAGTYRGTVSRPMSAPGGRFSRGRPLQVWIRGAFLFLPPWKRIGSWARGKNAASLKQIRAALSFAYKHWDLKNPFAKIEPPLQNEPQIRYLLLSQIRRLLDYLKSRRQGYGSALAFHLGYGRDAAINPHKERNSPAASRLTFHKFQLKQTVGVNVPIEEWDQGRKIEETSSLRCSPTPRLLDALAHACSSANLSRDPSWSWAPLNIVNLSQGDKHISPFVKRPQVRFGTDSAMTPNGASQGKLRPDPIVLPQQTRNERIAASDTAKQSADDARSRQINRSCPRNGSRASVA